jgi:hypothetical protein
MKEKAKLHVYSVPDFVLEMSSSKLRELGCIICYRTNQSTVKGDYSLSILCYTDQGAAPKTSLNHKLLSSGKSCLPSNQ